MIIDRFNIPLFFVDKVIDKCQINLIYLSIDKRKYIRQIMIPLFVKYMHMKYSFRTRNFIFDEKTFM